MSVFNTEIENGFIKERYNNFHKCLTYISKTNDKIPFGFFDMYDKGLIISYSEYHAINYYRETLNAEEKLKNKWNYEINKQDYLYKLSKATETFIKLPKAVNESFIPRPHQLVAIEFGKLTNGKFIIADQQRTGKSYSSLLYVLSENWEKCLIVCPAKLTLVWENMIKTICNFSYKILKPKDELVSGFNIISYDILHTIDDLKCNIAITDEGHYFVKGNNRRSNAVFRIESDKKIILSGTPILNNINELFTLVAWLGEEYSKQLFDFKLYFENNTDITNYEKSKLIAKELKKRYLLLRESYQVGVAKDPYINIIEVDVNVKDKKNFNDIGKELANYAVQYVNSFTNKIVIMVYHKDVGRILNVRLGNKSLLVNGDNSNKDVKEAIEKFKNDDNIQFLIGSTVLAEGIDLSFCDHILMIEESYSIRTDQMRERVSSINKEQEIIIDILVAKDTQDVRKYDILDSKFNLQYGLRDA